MAAFEGDEREERRYDSHAVGVRWGRGRTGISHVGRDIGRSGWVESDRGYVKDNRMVRGECQGQSSDGQMKDRHARVPTNFAFDLIGGNCISLHDRVDSQGERFAIEVKTRVE